MLDAAAGASFCTPRSAATTENWETDAVDVLVPAYSDLHGSTAAKNPECFFSVTLASDTGQALSKENFRWKRFGARGCVAVALPLRRRSTL